MPQATNYASRGREDECGLKFWVDYIDNLGAVREEYEIEKWKALT